MQCEEKRRKMFEKDLWKKLLAEFVGAFVLVLAVVFPGVALRDAGLGAFLFIMFTAGIGYSIVVWMFRDISGAHANPVVTFANVLLRKTTIVTGLLYWVAQLAGSVVAALYTAATFKVDGTLSSFMGYAVASPTPGYKDIQIALAEAAAVFVLVSVVLAVAQVKEKVSAGLAIGFAMLVAIVMSAPISGGALNPAREFGVLFMTKGVFKDTYLWFYLVAPLVGSAVAALVHLVMNEKISLKIASKS